MDQHWPSFHQILTSQSSKEFSFRILKQFVDLGQRLGSGKLRLRHVDSFCHLLRNSDRENLEAKLLLLSILPHFEDNDDDDDNKSSFKPQIKSAFLEFIAILEKAQISPCLAALQEILLKTRSQLVLQGIVQLAVHVTDAVVLDQLRATVSALATYQPMKPADDRLAMLESVFTIFLNDAAKSEVMIRLRERAVDEFLLPLLSHCDLSVIRLFFSRHLDKIKSICLKFDESNALLSELEQTSKYVSIASAFALIRSLFSALCAELLEDKQAGIAQQFLADQKEDKPKNIRASFALVASKVLRARTTKNTD